VGSPLLLFRYCRNLSSIINYLIFRISEWVENLYPIKTASDHGGTKLAEQVKKNYLASRINEVSNLITSQVLDPILRSICQQ